MEELFTLKADVHDAHAAFLELAIAFDGTTPSDSALEALIQAARDLEAARKKFTEKSGANVIWLPRRTA